MSHKHLEGTGKVDKPENTGQQEKKGLKGKIEALKDRIAEHAKSKREGTERKSDTKLDKDNPKDAGEKKSQREEFLERIRVDKTIEATRPSDKKSTNTSENGHGEKYDNSGRDERIPPREVPTKNNEVPQKDDKDLSFREKLKVDSPHPKSFESTSVKPEVKEKDNDDGLSL